MKRILNHKWNEKGVSLRRFLVTLLIGYAELTVLHHRFRRLLGFFFLGNLCNLKNLCNLWSFFILLFLLPLPCFAQCPATNTAFKAGEELNYTLYFNWKFIWIKCGSATYTTKNGTYNGQACYRSDLLFRTNKKFDKFFTLRDTLLSYVSYDLVPLYFYKASLEGKNHRLEEVWYSYPQGKSHAKLKYTNPSGDVFPNEVTQQECIYDMMSMMALARSFDPKDYKKGQRLHFSMTSSELVEPQTILYKGKENFKANDGVTYRCLVFSMLDWEDRKKEKEILRFYFSDDENHLPLRIDFNLKFGTAKAFYTDGKNLRNPVNSIVKEKKK
ncbi:MAG: DUF3108 domain-containing protein [Bacteroidaceae bacterium]|nr:DUF3108 domain-containing protein [Bacteroidaceae bacterium]